MEGRAQLQIPEPAGRGIRLPDHQAQQQEHGDPAHGRKDSRHPHREGAGPDEGHADRAR